MAGAIQPQSIALVSEREARNFVGSERGNRVAGAAGVAPAGHLVRIVRASQTESDQQAKALELEAFALREHLGCASVCKSTWLVWLVRAVRGVGVRGISTVSALHMCWEVMSAAQIRLAGVVRAVLAFGVRDVGAGRWGV